MQTRTGQSKQLLMRVWYDKNIIQTRYHNTVYHSYSHMANNKQKVVYINNKDHCLTHTHHYHSFIHSTNLDYRTRIS